MDPTQRAVTAPAKTSEGVVGAEEEDSGHFEGGERHRGDEPPAAAAGQFEAPEDGERGVAEEKKRSLATP